MSTVLSLGVRDRVRQAFWPTPEQRRASAEIVERRETDLRQRRAQLRGRLDEYREKWNSRK